MTPILLIALWTWSPLLAIGLMALSHLLVVYATLRPNVQWLGPVVTRFETDRKELWLTVDDGPTDDTDAVLQLFERLNVRATFFLKGAVAEQFPERVVAITSHGHSIANHSHTHPSGTFWCLPPRRIADEIDRCNQTLAALCGERPRWFRAPVGMKNPAVHPILAKREMRLIGWSVRAFDGVETEPESVLRRLVPHFRPGTILVLHQGRHASLSILESVISAAQSRGYSFVIPADAQLRT